MNTPINKLGLCEHNKNEPLIVLLGCGSFSPVTYMHLRMFEMARDFVGNPENVVGYMSPVGDAYNKKGLVSATHRVKMCELATQSSDWIMVDPWESLQADYQPTVIVMDRLKKFLSETLLRPVQVKLLCGADLLESFNRPGVWSDEDMERISGEHGIICLERENLDLRRIISEHHILANHEIVLVPQPISNNVSATKIRQLVGESKSIKYLVPDPVIDYIHEHKLFKE